MSMFGIFRACGKLVEGVVEGDMEKCLKGGGSLALTAAGWAVWLLFDDEETSEALAQQGDELIEDA